MLLVLNVTADRKQHSWKQPSLSSLTSSGIAISVMFARANAHDPRTSSIDPNPSRTRCSFVPWKHLSARYSTVSGMTSSETLVRRTTSAPINSRDEEVPNVTRERFVQLSKQRSHIARTPSGTTTSNIAVPSKACSPILSSFEPGPNVTRSNCLQWKKH